TLHAGCTGHAALPQLTALLRNWRLARWLRRPRLRGAGRVRRRSRLSGRRRRAGLGLARPRRQSRPWRARLLLSLPVFWPVLQSAGLRLTGLSRQRRLSGLAGQALAVGRARLLLARTVLQSRLLLLSGAVLAGQTVLAARLAGQAVLPQLTGLLPGLADRPVRIHQARIGAAEGALLVEHAA